MSTRLETPQKQPFNYKMANQFADQLRKGDSPLQKNGVQSIPYNPVNGRPFHGANALHLMMQGRRDDRWYTFDDARNNGYRIKAGQHGTQIQYKPKSRSDSNRTPLQTVYVFNAEQFDRIPPQPHKPQRRDAFERVNELLASSGMKVFHDQKDRSFYALRADEIHLPKPESFASKEKYCATAMYHYFQAMGHPNRQDRATFNPITQADRLKEETICGVATMMYCAEIGIPHDPLRHAESSRAVATTVENHPEEFSGALRDADTAVWATLRHEMQRDNEISPQENEVWRPTPEASPHKAVEAFVNHNRILALAEEDPKKLYTFQYEENDIYVLPHTGRVVGKSTDHFGDETEITARVRTDGYDRDGNTYAATMEATTRYFGGGESELVAPPMAVDINKTNMAMALPLDWTGELNVHGCVEDAEGNISIVPEGTDRQEVDFYGVYAKTDEGLEYNVCDYASEQYALKYVSLVEREYTQQTGRELPARQTQSLAHDNQAAFSPELPPQEEFASAMRSVGMIVDGEHPIFDKQPHRIEVEGDKKGERSGFYVAHPDGRPAGYCKNNRTGEEQRWAAKGYFLDESQKQELHQQAKQHVAKRTEELAAEHDKAAKRVQGMMKRFDTLEQPTAYLNNKQVDLHPGVYANGNSTCIPLYNASGEVRSMAYVQEDGTKRYAKNTEKEGCYHVIGGQDKLADSPAIVISEGYATAASVTESLGFATVAAFDAGNLEAVAKSLHDAMPGKPVIIAGDNDAKQEAENGHNPGKEHANQAAQAVGGIAVFPIFTPAEQETMQLTDFNDLATKSELGKEGLKSQLAPVVEQAVEKHQNQEQEREQKQEQELTR